MAVGPNDRSLAYIPLEEAVNPIDGLNECFKDYFWLVYPGRGIICYQRYVHNKPYGSAKPWCNKNEEICKRIRDMHYPWAIIQQIPLVFIKRSPKDYE